MANNYRSATIGEVSSALLEQSLKLAGWVFRKRDHGLLLFIDLRDNSGIIQLVFDSNSPSLNNETSLLSAKNISYESVIIVEGILKKRAEATINHEIINGNLELYVTNWYVESKAEPLPFLLESEYETAEELRLKYRYLDLRRSALKNNIILRSKVIANIREFMHSKGFTEFQTPILTASSPEGARDYLVPSRIHKGKFYALPQAPQQFKQILMVAGFDKYFQIAPCFRDEDSRADRSPGEFYQLDIEMSFVTEEEIFALTEELLYNIFSKFSNKKMIKGSFPRIPYNEALLKYGSDKPDLRNSIIISDATEIFKAAEFSIFKKNIAEKNMIVRAIPAPGAGNNSRSFFDNLIKYAIEILGASGLGYINFTNELEAKGPIAKFLSKEEINQIVEGNNLKGGDAIFFSCEAEKAAAKIAGNIRTKLWLDSPEAKLVADEEFKFCWVTDFPYFEYNEQLGKLDFAHNPFSMPKGGLEALENENPLKILSRQYDIVCNGIELSSGAIRSHKPEIIYKAFSILGYNSQYVEEHFGALITSFKYGAPPHGGLAPGIDRILMLLAGAENIREVIAFPMNQKCEDLMMRAPCNPEAKHLRELSLMLKN